MSQTQPEHSAPQITQLQTFESQTNSTAHQPPGGNKYPQAQSAKQLHDLRLEVDPRQAAFRLEGFDPSNRRGEDQTLFHLGGPSIARASSENEHENHENH